MLYFINVRRHFLKAGENVTEVYFCIFTLSSGTSVFKGNLVLILGE